MLDKLTADDFESLQDKKLSVRFGDDRLQSAKIVEVKRREHGSPETRTPFSVILESGSNDRYWPQGTYMLAHPEHGELALFMVPLGPSGSGMRYEIAIN